jgi:hypothetical protein
MLCIARKSVGVLHQQVALVLKVQAPQQQHQVHIWSTSIPTGWLKSKAHTCCSMLTTL